MERGESSGTKLADDVLWAKLIPSNLDYVELRSDNSVVCSEVKISSSEKNEWCKIARNSDFCSATLQNISSNVIMVDETKLQSEDSIVIKSGSKIITGPVDEGYFSYKFEVTPEQDLCKKMLKICIDPEHARCGICLNIWHDVVTVAPCLHNFCNGCFSEWLRRSQHKHSAVCCPQCRAVVQFVGRNHFLHNIEEYILEADSSLKRSNEEIVLLDSCASIRSPLVINSRKSVQRKRLHSFLDEETNTEEHPCPQCGNELGGFQCNQNTIHLQCQACGGMMPSRNDISAVLHCSGCDRAFCGAYWHAQGIINIDSHPMCSRETFKPISERTITRIPFVAHEKNRHEQAITEMCIRQMGRTLQDVISEWIVKLNNREIDRTRMQLNHAEMITIGTHLCNDCYDKLVSFLLYWFRITLPKSCLPSDVSQRENCWYGYACRTQHRSEEHACKRNHVCRPTRGSVM